MLEFDPPIFINVRDRLTPLRVLVSWLERAGHERIVLLDNDSSYPPLLEWLEASPHDVRRVGRNLGSRSVWLGNFAPRSDWYVASDPDCIPLERCPLDAVARLREVLGDFRRAPKAGLGLYLADLPEDLHFMAWERSLVGIASEQFPKPRGVEIAPGVFDSMIDTTFALYRPGAAFGYAGLRLGFPYQCRHTSWYVDESPTAEDRYYLERARVGPLGSSWAQRLAEVRHGVA